MHEIKTNSSSINGYTLNKLDNLWNARAVSAIILY